MSVRRIFAGARRFDLFLASHGSAEESPGSGGCPQDSRARKETRRYFGNTRTLYCISDARGVPMATKTSDSIHFFSSHLCLSRFVAAISLDVAPCSTAAGRKCDGTRNGRSSIVHHPSSPVYHGVYCSTVFFFFFFFF